MTTVDQAIEDFQLANRADGLSEKTSINYRYLLVESPHSLPAWLREQGYGGPLGSITTAMLRQHIVWLRGRLNMRTGDPLADQTINDHVRALHRFFRWSSAEYDLANPMARISYPRHQPAQRHKAISLADVGKLLAACNPTTDKGIRDRAIIAFLIDTGCRAGGICRLAVTDVNLAERTALITEKGKRTRLVCFTRRTSDLLRAWLMRRSTALPAFFHNIRTGEAFTVNGLRQTLKKVGATCGVWRCNPHSFRHAFAREYLKAGGDLVTLSLLLGHGQITKTANHYALFTHHEVAAKHERFSPMNKIAA